MKFRTKFIRIGTGLSAIAAGLAWFWPKELFLRFEDGNGLLAFITATIVWLVSELATSDKPNSADIGPNDVHRAREIIRLHTYELRIVLKENSTWSFLDDRYYQLCGRLTNFHEIGEFVFLDAELQKTFENFVEKLDDFILFIAENAVPEQIGGQWRTGFKPFNIVSDEVYDLRRQNSDIADDKANVVWLELGKLVEVVKRKVPEAYDARLDSLEWSPLND